jgi:hypothetical protein
MYCPNSITALQQLLFSGSPLTPTSAKEEGGDSSGKKNIHCHITKKFSKYRSYEKWSRVLLC